MKLILSLLKDSLGLSIVAVVAGVVAGIGNTLLLGFVNAGLANRSSDMLGRLIVSFAVVCVVVAGSRFLSQDLMARFAQRNLRELRMKLGRRVLSSPLRAQEEIGANRILAVFTEDVPAIANAVIAIPAICTNLVIVVGCMVYLGMISGKLLLGVIGFIIVGIVTCQIPIARATRYMNTVRETSDVLLKQLKAMTEGSKELKIHRDRREAFLSKLLANTTQDLQRNNIITNSIFNGVNSWAQTLVFVLMGMIVFVPYAWIQLEPLQLTSYILILLFMIGPLLVVMSSIPSFSRAKVALNKLAELDLSLDKFPSEVQAEAAATSSRWHNLQLSQVKHSYVGEGDNNFVLGPIDLKLRAGELVFLTGGNGSGKTTLAKILTGLYVPETGELNFNNEPITDANRDSFRQHFSTVFSDAFIFETLLGLDKPELDQEAKDLLAQFQIDHKVQVKDGALSTIDLSQGQRKRLALLTAYLENRPIYVFDEWAADQDPQFREIFYYQLLPELTARGKTVIVISHDDRYYHVADRIITLDYGKVSRDEARDGSRIGSDLALAM
jgi:putative pyoverdin transport system ATP-binding/permease protein